MRHSAYILLIAFNCTFLYGQDSCGYENIGLHVETISRSYNYGYRYDDSLSVKLYDSIIINTYLDSTIIQKIHYERIGGKPGINEKLSYLNHEKKDSVSKHFVNGLLRFIYSWQYDSLNRLKIYSLKTFNKDYKPDFTWFYEYHDTISKDGQVYYKTIFVDDNYGDKRFHFRVETYFDNSGTQYKELRISSTGDTIIYGPDREEIINDTAEVREIKKYWENYCSEEIITQDFMNFSFNSKDEIVYKHIQDLGDLIKSDSCEHFIYQYYSPDKSIQLTIRKLKPHREKSATFTIISKGSS